jgi:hypothetical protein
MPGEGPEELELHVRQLDGLLAHLDRPAAEVDPQPVDGDHFLLVGPVVGHPLNWIRSAFRLRRTRAHALVAS